MVVGCIGALYMPRMECGHEAGIAWNKTLFAQWVVLSNKSLYMPAVGSKKKLSRSATDGKAS